MDRSHTDPCIPYSPSQSSSTGRNAWLHSESFHAGNCPNITVNRIAVYCDLYKPCENGNPADKLS